MENKDEELKEFIKTVAEHGKDLEDKEVFDFYFESLKEIIGNIRKVNKDLLRKNKNQKDKLRLQNGFKKSWLFKVYLLFHKNGKGRNRTSNTATGSYVN
jgi:hypothetical protein